MVDERKPGRRDRGARKNLLSRVPDDQYAVYEAAAERLGIPIGSYSTMRLAEIHNLPVPDYILEEIRAAADRRAAAAAKASRDQIAGFDSLEGGRPLARSA
ncbi:hypothetical protein [Microbacterium sp. LB12]|uniref:hypothetical protein n=1 Tax=Microbacterium sp. LB12 TaxID=3081270 RepID=UPI0030183B90